jgi:flagellar P-ring protein precursor FlgI
MERNSTLFTPKARETKLRRLVLGALAALLVLAAAGAADAMSRIKDIADFEGVRENQLVGYGLIVGLNGTGDR